MTTTVPPRRWAVMDHTSGAEWYSGAGLRYTSPGANPMMPPSMPESTTSEPKGWPVSGRRIPLGWPVVPEEYSIGGALDLLGQRLGRGPGDELVVGRVAGRRRRRRS